MSITGIYWYGPVFDMGGYGNVSRNYLKAIEKVGIPVQIHSSGGHHLEEIGYDTVEWLNRLSTTELGERVAIIRHSTPELFEYPLTVPNSVLNIGVTIFETDRIPDGWAELCNRMDEIWVPSQFNLKTFTQSGVDALKIKVLPYPIDVDAFYPGKPYRTIEFDRTMKSFKFLYTSAFDYRKGYDLLIKAFCEEFSDEEDVALLLKVYIPHWAGKSKFNIVEELQSYIPTDLNKNIPQIVLLIESYTNEQLLSLYQTADVYVTTDRANGWGMPAMEMMALGKPTITINWSGSTQFMNESNSFLIQPEDELEPVAQMLQTSRPNHYLHHQWAKVRCENVQEVMRYAYENKVNRFEKSRNAALDIHQNYSPQAVGNLIMEMLCEK